jgi:hypothetical protein
LYAQTELISSDQILVKISGAKRPRSVMRDVQENVLHVIRNRCEGTSRR